MNNITLTGNEFDFVHGDRKLVLDFVDVQSMELGVLAQRDDAAVREQLLIAKARLEPLPDGLRAREKENDQVVGPRLPLLGRAQPEVAIARVGHRGTPESPERIARRTAGCIGENLQVGADALAERLDIEAHRFERQHDAPRPGP